MKILSGHLTEANKQAVKAILSANLTEGKVRGTNYYLRLYDGIYTVKIVKKDRGLIPCPGTPLRLSNYSATFEL